MLKAPSLRAILTVASLSPEHGGPSRSVEALARELARQAIQIEVITCEEGANGDGESHGQKDQVTVIRLPAGCRKWQWLPRCNGYYREIRARLHSAGCCLVHDTGLWLASNHACATAARFLHLPLVISPRGMLSPWAMRFHGTKKHLAWIAYQRRDLASA
ncbi:MAG TPA: glycosyltransferase, partial [Verrucomicrobiae bacterium]|nr:glycosyltransferase [Verrucomicrobiae bacterium]